ncbi:hypothetical protein [Erythrobacter dokdonensis]|uniref:Uncharacterized protein n=1 Tax=Erythrobacter dokdonensis DSW-74 TaxID=1300349 RepID=A0A1A7BMG5_9SPHN|nr:hypothetical protein [Erythrobacter dokdonensis]OBV12667.1 hypothetical protein I603_0798 [Erythrobacter dokdonensis DSW-74]
MHWTVSTILTGILAATSTTQATPSFCQRMAAELPMKEKKVKGTVRAFDMQTLNAAQRLLLGGSSQFSFKIEPVENTPEEAERIDAMCDLMPCTMEGPFVLTMLLQDGSRHIF